jgi:hypothetical protein
MDPSELAQWPGEAEVAVLDTKTAAETVVNEPTVTHVTSGSWGPTGPRTPGPTYDTIRKWAAWAVQGLLSPLGSVGKGVAVTGGGAGCLVVCYGLEGSFGLFLTAAGPDDLLFGEAHVFFTLGGAGLGITPAQGGMGPAPGLAFGGGVSVQGFVTEARTGDSFSGWLRNVEASGGPFSLSYGWNSAGQRTVSFGLGLSAGAGVSSWNTYTWLSDPFWK